MGGMCWALAPQPTQISSPGGPARPVGPQHGAMVHREPLTVFSGDEVPRESPSGTCLLASRLGFWDTSGVPHKYSSIGAGTSMSQLSPQFLWAGEGGFGPTCISIFLGAGTLCGDMESCRMSTAPRAPGTDRERPRGCGWRAHSQGGSVRSPEGSGGCPCTSGPAALPPRACPRTAVTAFGAAVHHTSQPAEAALAESDSSPWLNSPQGKVRSGRRIKVK